MKGGRSGADALEVEETPIEIVQRETFRMSVTWGSSDTPPVPNSLADYYAHMQVRRKAGAPGEPLIEVSSVGVDPGLMIEPGGDTGVVQIIIGATKTALLNKDCHYDLFIIKTDNPDEALRLVFGPVTVSPSVTTAVTAP